MGRNIRIGDTPLDWYVQKFGASDYKLSREGQAVPKLKFKRKRKKRRKRTYIPPEKVNTIVDTKECGRIVLRRYIGRKKLEERFPTLVDVRYQKR